MKQSSRDLDMANHSQCVSLLAQNHAGRQRVC